MLCLLVAETSWKRIRESSASFCGEQLVESRVWPSAAGDGAAGVDGWPIDVEDQPKQDESAD